MARKARLRGTVEGRLLRFSYVEPDGSRGTGRFDLVPGSEAFLGTWESEQGPEGVWSGERVRPVPGRTWLVVLEAHWEGSLTAEEYSYGSMLRAFFARAPGVEVRHRFVHDAADLRRWCGELAYLVEPVVLYVSSHGTEQGIQLGSEVVGAGEISAALADVPDLHLLHFGSCRVLGGGVPAAIRASRAGDARFPISGYTRDADWAGSAITDFTYLELVLARGIAPAAAVRHTLRTVLFAGEEGGRAHRWFGASAL